MYQIPLLSTSYTSAYSHILPHLKEMLVIVLLLQMRKRWLREAKVFGLPQPVSEKSRFDPRLSEFLIMESHWSASPYHVDPLTKV